MGYNNSDLIFSNFAKGKHTFKEILEKYDVILDELDLLSNDKQDTLTQKFIEELEVLLKE